MAQCDECGSHETLPYQCQRCGETFCAEHRLPENHDCPGLDGWNDPGGVFDSGFDDSVHTAGGTDDGITDRLSRRASGIGGILGYVRGNVAYTVLGLMWIVFALQFALRAVAPGLEQTVFVLTTTHPEYVWTWVTSIFAHGGFGHIAANSIVLYFFGPIVERQIGSKRFAALFLAAGVLAGLAQVGTTLLMEPGTVAGVVGASGGLMAVMGLLTVLRPKMKVYLYFIIPMPLWILTFGFAGLSVVAGFSSIGAMGNVAHLAHLTGLVIGLVYGRRVKGRQRVPDSLTLGGRGGGPGGPGGPGGRGPF